jgi:large subunit ribosomal protein L24
MIASGKPRKQRYFRFNAPLHARQHFVGVHLDKRLKEKLSIKRRSIPIVAGDSVRVVSGANKGKEGKVVSVDLKNCRITIESLKRKNSKGKEKMLGISSNNVYIIDLNLTDKIRASKLKVAAQPKVQPAPKQKANVEETEAAPVESPAPQREAVHTVRELKQI